MLSLTRRTEYALVVLTDMVRQGSNLESTRTLEERTKVPRRALTNILHQLTRHGIVVSTRGVNGGYRMAKRPETISLTALIEAVEGPIHMVRCCAPEFEVESSLCLYHNLCKIRAPIQQIDLNVRQMLDQISVLDVAENNIPAYSNGKATPENTTAGEAEDR